MQIDTTKSRDITLLAGRILLSVLFATMGWGKLTDFQATVSYMAQTGAPFPPLSAAIAIVTELGGAAAIALGGLTGLAAPALAVYAIVTALIGHKFWTMTGLAAYDNMIHFYKNVGLAGGFLLLAASGPGLFSLDALLKRVTGRVTRRGSVAALS